MEKKKRAIIIGAGPAGLTAAFELAKRTDIEPIVLEKSAHMGGLACTINYKGNRIDIGGHRFFSKSDQIMHWWLDVLPLQAMQEKQLDITYQRKKRTIKSDQQGPDPDKQDAVMLIRSRKSRIYFNRTFFDYPLQLNLQTIKKLGFIRVLRIGLSYMYRMCFPLKENNLQDFFINRFGYVLYKTFFKSYTEKVWGVPCTQISAEWGAQRIKGLSISKALKHFVNSLFKRKNDIEQKDTETSLIERFLYPKFGPGQMWDCVANQVMQQGGQVITNNQVTKIILHGEHIVAVEARDVKTGNTKLFEGDYFFSTMPIKELVSGLQMIVPHEIKEIAQGLSYRDFITVGLLVKKLKVKDQQTNGLIKDNWIYIQEPDVQVGRLQIFNNWSPYMIADPSTVWLGLEYFCYESDKIWQWSKQELIDFGASELEKIGIINKKDLIDGTVIWMPKAYPAYFGSYDRFDQLKVYLDQFENLFLIGRNGMHKYNNQDHSMLAAMTAVENVINKRTDKSNIWIINTEQEYHEAKHEASS